MQPGHGDTVEFGVLGPLSIKVAGTAVDIGAAKVRIILASLLLRPNRLMSVDELVDRLWGHEPPKDARSALQKYVYRLRNALGPAGNLIRTDAAGYRVQVAREAIDLEQFRGHLLQAQKARASGELPAEASALHTGLALWRGRPLVDVPSPLLQDHEVPHLVEEHLKAVERRIEVDLELGRQADLVGELYGLTAEHPLRERFWFQLMIALYRSGRQGDALSAYAQVSRVLREELGLDPGEQLRNLHQQILAADRALAPPRRSPAGAGKQWSLPFQVPPDVVDFVGRADLVDRIRSLIGAADPASPGVPIVTLSGPPGVGKTALAIHVAHQLRSDFPDGQLYVNLRGYSASRPMAVGGVLEQFLRALGISSELIPHHRDEQSALFRSTLADRRVLVVLDDARSSDQVRPLLPGNANCPVVVTSRDNLPGLSALNGARRILLETVSPDEALALLSRILGPERVAAERADAETLAARCGYLPLALRIVAANLEAPSGQSIALMARRLRSGNRLAALTLDGDDKAAVHRAIELSYNALPPDLARLFRLLSLAPGLHFDRHVAANLAGIRSNHAQRMLGRLAATNLIHGVGAGRFQFHDLIRDFARDHTRSDGRLARRRAYRSLFDHYVHAADTACRRLYPDLHPAVTAPAPHCELELPEWESPAAALAWLEAEVDNMVAAAGCRDEDADGVPVWQLASALLSHLLRHRRDAAWQTVCAAGLEAAERQADRAAAAAMKRSLGHLGLLHTDYAHARHLLRSSLDTFQALGDSAEQVRVLLGLAPVALETAEYAEAVSYYGRAVSLLGDTGTAATRATALLGMGTVLQLIGEADPALSHLSRARAVAEQAGLRHISTRADAVVALNHMWVGRLDDALATFGHTLSTWQARGFRQGIAETLRNMAETHFEADRFSDSLELAEHALGTAEEVGYMWAIVGSNVTLGAAHLRLGDNARAATYLSRARELTKNGLRYWYAPAGLHLAEHRRQHGAWEEAARLADEVLSDPRPRVRGRAHAARARAALSSADRVGCIHHASQARQLAAERDYRLDEARALEILADAHRESGQVANARAHLRMARRLYAEAEHRASERLQELIDRL